MNPPPNTLIAALFIGWVTGGITQSLTNGHSATVQGLVSLGLYAFAILVVYTLYWLEVYKPSQRRLNDYQP